MLKTLSVKNFRNIKIGEIKFSPGLNILLGQNAQGKTNILESIYFLAYGRPIRGNRSQVINWQEQQAQVAGETEKENIRLLIDRDEETKVLIGGKNKRVVDLFGRLTCVFFHPRDIELLAGEPSDRRNWLDKLISVTDRKYLFNLARYQKILKNKNHLLKIKAGDEETDSWSRHQASYGSNIWQDREKTVKELNLILRRDSADLIGKPLKMLYKTPIHELDEKEGEKKFLQELTRLKEAEKKVGLSLYGPQRDDFRLVVEERDDQTIVEKDLSLYGSRAEIRQAAILLKIAEGKLFAQKLGSLPTLLLDDISSELDEKNRELLLSHLPGQQAILTTTSLSMLTPGLVKKGLVFEIAVGEIKKSYPGSAGLGSASGAA